MLDLEPKDLIDRKAEQELFGNLVSHDSDARMLTVSDDGGRGKSSLLRRLRYNCQHEIKPPMPRCLIELDQDKFKGFSPLTLVSSIVGEMKLRGVNVGDRFAKFGRLNEARIAQDFSQFDSDQVRFRRYSPLITGTMTTGPVGTNAIAAGVNVQHIETFRATGREEFTEEQEQLAQRRCIEAFFDDLRSICATDRMVIIFDAWERCNSDLREWIHDDLLGNHVLHPDTNFRPAMLSVVIAGRPYHPMRAKHGLRLDEFRPLFDSDEEYSAAVLSIKSLTQWETEHVKDFLVLNGCPQPTDAEVEVIREKLGTGMSLEKAASLINDYFKPRAG